MNIRRKLLLLLLGVSLIPLALLFALYAFSFFETSRNNAALHLSDLADAAAQQLDDILVTGARDSKAMARHLAEHPGDAAAISAELAGFTYSYPYFAEVLWVAPSGTVRAASNPAHVGQRLDVVAGDAVAAFARALGQPAGAFQVSDLAEVTPQLRAALRAGSADSRALTLQFLLRVDDARGEPTGVLVASLHTEPLMAVLRDAQRRAQSDVPVALLNASGELLLSSGAGQLLEAYPLAAALASARRSVPQPQRTYELSDAQGTELIAAVGTVSTTFEQTSHALAWRVLVSVSSQAVTAQARQTFTQSRYFILVVLVLVLALGYYVARHVGRSIEALATGAARLATGDLVYRIAPGSNDELGALGHTLNNMSKRIGVLLEEQSAALAQQVALGARLDERTIELEATLAQAERQNHEITLRNELGDLLQSCVSIEEAGAVVTRLLPLLFPGASGAIYMATPGVETLAAVARWGAAPLAQTMEPQACWAIRRGKTHLATADDATLACAHVTAPLVGDSLCVPLSAHGEALGLLHLCCLPPRGWHHA